MRKLFAGVTLCLALMVLGVAAAWADDNAGMNEVTGIPLYEGPGYSSLDSPQRDVNNLPPEFHTFQNRGVDEVGYSPLTLADFRFPVAMRTLKEFKWERMSYPKQAVQVWKNNCGAGTVTAFFFTRDMVRDHIQGLIDEYYVCDPDMVQQLIDYYAEVTPQCGEAISWVWFRVDDPQNAKCLTSGEPNRYFANYLSNFKDKFYLEFGLPKVQNSVDNQVHKFLYQYEDRGKYGCSPDLKKLKCSKCKGKGCSSCGKCDSCGSGCDKGTTKCGGCASKSCGGCDSCTTKCGDCGGKGCKKCGMKGEIKAKLATGCAAPCGGLYLEEDKLQMAADAAAAQSGGKQVIMDKCGCTHEGACETGTCQKCCPKKSCKVYDKQIDCRKLKYKGFGYNPNEHYVYYPRKAVIEDITYDEAAQAYRWKFAWRFNDCETDLLKQFCQYGINTQMALVLSDPTWYAHEQLSNGLKRSILASVDPNTWGNVWPAGNLPFDDSCCPCQLPNCKGNCSHQPMVGFDAPVPPAAQQPEIPVEEPYFPPPVETPPTQVEGRG